MKRCCRCKTMQSLSEFYGGGKSHRCKSCERAYCKLRAALGGPQRRPVERTPEVDPPLLSFVLRRAFEEEAQHGPVRILVKDGKPVEGAATT